MFPSARLVFKVVGAELTAGRQLALTLLLGSLAACHALRRERKAAWQKTGSGHEGRLQPGTQLLEHYLTAQCSASSCSMENILPK
jgi:hypothetical protein